MAASTALTKQMAPTLDCNILYITKVSNEPGSDSKALTLRTVCRASPTKRHNCFRARPWLVQHHSVYNNRFMFIFKLEPGNRQLVYSKSRYYYFLLFISRCVQQLYCDTGHCVSSRILSTTSGARSDHHSWRLSADICGVWSPNQYIVRELWVESGCSRFSDCIYTG